MAWVVVGHGAIDLALDRPFLRIVDGRHWVISLVSDSYLVRDPLRTP